MADGIIDVTKPTSSGVSLPTALDQTRANFVETAKHIANTADAHGLAVIIAGLTAAVNELAAARGTRGGLSARLDQALNPDGTLRANITQLNISEWVDPQYVSVSRTDACTFGVPGDQTSIMVQYRKVAITDGNKEAYGMVKASSHAAGTTTVTLYDPAVMDNPTGVKYGFVTPGPLAAASLDSRVMTFANAAAHYATIGGF